MFFIGEVLDRTKSEISSSSFSVQHHFDHSGSILDGDQGSGVSVSEDAHKTGVVAWMHLGAGRHHVGAFHAALGNNHR